MKPRSLHKFQLPTILMVLIFFGSSSIKSQGEALDSSRIETFTFSNNGVSTRGKIYLPPSYSENQKLPTIYLIDFTEQHFKLATDEFEKVIDGVHSINGFEAMVVSLEGIPDIDAEPDSFEEHYQLFKNLVSYVDAHYSNALPRTFIGKGSESGIVMMVLLKESPENSLFDNFIATDPSGLYANALIKTIENNNFTRDKSKKKLHFSFSTSNDRAKCLRLIDVLEKAKFPWLQFRVKEYTDSNYENTYPLSYAEGLDYIFNTE